MSDNPANSSCCAQDLLGLELLGPIGVLGRTRALARTFGLLDLVPISRALDTTGRLFLAIVRHE